MSVKRADRKNRVEQINVRLSKENTALKARVESLVKELTHAAHGAMHDLCDDLANAAALPDDGWDSLALDEKKVRLVAAHGEPTEEPTGDARDDNEDPGEDPPKAGKKK